MWKFLLTDEEYNQFHFFLNINLKIEAKNYLINILIELKINYCDIIKSCSRKVYSTKDDDLINMHINYELIDHILNNSNKNIILNFNTSSVYNKQNFNLVGGILTTNKVQSLNLFLRCLQDLGYLLKIDLLDNNGYVCLNNLPIPHFYKIYFKLKVEKKNFTKEFYINTTPSPSGDANRTFPSNKIYNNWLNQLNNVNLNTPTTHFRKYIYQLFRNNNWNELQAMNVYNYED